MRKTRPKTTRDKLIAHCKLLLLISKILYPKLPSYIFPTYMLLKYIKVSKAKLEFKIKPVPYELLIKISKSDPLFDCNSSVIVNAGFYKAILNCAEYVKLKSAEKERLVQIVPGCLNEGELLASYNLNYNLGECSDFKIKSIDISAIKIADEVDVALIPSFHNIGGAVVELLLKNFFGNPKLLYKNDVFAVNFKHYAPDYYYTNVKLNEIENVHFKCVNIKVGDITDCSGGCFCVLGATTLKQSADTLSILPQKYKLVKEVFCDEDNCYENYLVDLCPPGLNQYLQQLERAVRPFLISRKIKLNPVFSIQGSKGSGKHLILQALSAKFGLKLCKLTTSDLSAQAYAQNEIKMRNAFFRAKLCAPCIVAIYNFENICKNNEGQHDPRIINYFKSELDTLVSNNEHPIIFICVSNIKDLPSELGRLFLESVNVDAPNQNERLEILNWILKYKAIPTTLSLEEVAGKTHGFLFEDLQALIYYAKKNMIINSTGRSLQAIDFEVALDIMQSNYTESLGAPKVPKVQWSDVGGLDDVKHEIIKTINLPLKHPELLKTGLKRSGILLYGPPGTGKTLMAKAVATECGLCFLSVKGPELLNMYVGQSEQNVREVFEKARQASPCIIFFDELDSLAPNRGISGDSGGVMDRVVSQLLSEMDGLNQNGTIFVIGATNRPDLIDPALLRPGRFDKLLFVGPCTDSTSKLSVLKALTRNFKLSEKLSLERVVKACPENITGADFYGICSNAWMTAAARLIRKIEKGKIEKTEDVSNKNVLVTFKDFEESIKITKPSVSSEDLLYFEKLKRELGAKK